MCVNIFLCVNIFVKKKLLCTVRSTVRHTFDCKHRLAFKLTCVCLSTEAHITHTLLHPCDRMHSGTINRMRLNPSRDPFLGHIFLFSPSFQPCAVQRPSSFSLISHIPKHHQSPKPTTHPPPHHHATTHSHRRPSHHPHFHIFPFLPHFLINPTFLKFTRFVHFFFVIHTHKPWERIVHVSVLVYFHCLQGVGLDCKGILKLLFLEVPTKC
jgi:hypothetical protein